LLGQLYPGNTVRRSRLLQFGDFAENIRNAVCRPENVRNIKKAGIGVIGVQYVAVV